MSKDQAQLVLLLIIGIQGVRCDPFCNRLASTAPIKLQGVLASRTEDKFYMIMDNIGYTFTHNNNIGRVFFHSSFDLQQNSMLPTSIRNHKIDYLGVKYMESSTQEALFFCISQADNKRSFSQYVFDLKEQTAGKEVSRLVGNTRICKSYIIKDNRGLRSQTNKDNLNSIETAIVATSKQGQDRSIELERIWINKTVNKSLVNIGFVWPQEKGDQNVMFTEVPIGVVLGDYGYILDAHDRVIYQIHWDTIYDPSYKATVLSWSQVFCRQNTTRKPEKAGWHAWQVIVMCTFVIGIFAVGAVYLLPRCPRVHSSRIVRRFSLYGMKARRDKEQGSLSLSTRSSKSSSGAQGKLSMESKVKALEVLNRVTEKLASTTPNKNEVVDWLGRRRISV